MRSITTALTAAAALALAGTSNAAVVFDAQNSGGFFTPFNSGNAATVKYGDGGWLSNFGTDTYNLTRITLRLATFSGDGITPGTTDLNFTFNNGDPSGLVFGPGTTLYSTTITNVALPANAPGFANFFDIEIPLPNIITSGGFNNIGWSIGLSNYNYSGQFGVQTSGFQAVGFFTQNASFFNGTSWSLFSFGGGNAANFAALVEGFVVPAPGAVGVMGLAGVMALRRKR
ncbi:MAG: hypothetical protein ACKVZJ_08300 [Phycisphaerales bacterium]